jgi:hypothetical protein
MMPVNNAIENVIDDQAKADAALDRISETGTRMDSMVETQRNRLKNVRKTRNRILNPMICSRKLSFRDETR